MSAVTRIFYAFLDVMAYVLIITIALMIWFAIP
jgi:hypothetical protein